MWFGKKTIVYLYTEFTDKAYERIFKKISHGSGRRESFAFNYGHSLYFRREVETKIE